MLTTEEPLPSPPLPDPPLILHRDPPLPMIDDSVIPKVPPSILHRNPRPTRHIEKAKCPKCGMLVFRSQNLSMIF